MGREMEQKEIADEMELNETEVNRILSNAINKIVRRLYMDDNLDMMDICMGLSSYFECGYDEILDKLDSNHYQLLRDEAREECNLSEDPDINELSTFFD